MSPMTTTPSSGAPELLVCTRLAWITRHRLKTGSSPLRHDGPVAGDLDEQQARALVQQWLDITPIGDDDAWVITGAREADWGWLIYWANRRAAEGLGHRYAGAGPYLVDRRSGRVALCGSRPPVQQWVDLWRRGELPDYPSPQGRDPLPEPWFDLRPRPGAAHSPSRLAMTAELDRELMPGHRLHGERAEPLAKCSHCDSVIYELPAERFALVHLTWAHGPEQPPFPQTAVFTSWADALEAMGEHTA
jgi:hypothetical protein